MDTIVKKTNNSESAYQVALKLTDYFDGNGLKSIKEQTKSHLLYGIYLNNQMVGFVTYHPINSATIEMTWLGVLPEHQGKGYGEKLVSESLKDFAHEYQKCEVKTLAETDDYAPYQKTRAFYKSIGFTSREIIQNYPGWHNNPCQIFEKDL